MRSVVVAAVIGKIERSAKGDDQKEKDSRRKYEDYH
jgi:hypothetical protein